MVIFRTSLTNIPVTKKYVDLQKIIKENQPAVYKKVPKFVFKILEFIIRQKALNKVIHKLIEYEGVEYTQKMTEELNIDLTVHGKENLPENGRCFFCANHPFGVVDGMLLGNIVGSKYGTFMGISNDAFNLIPQLKNNITSVNVYGKSAKKQIETLEKVYKSDLPIDHFPAGEVSRNYKKKVEDKKWEKSFIRKAIDEKRDIVPILFDGKNSWLFYAIFSFRKFFKIKANIELVLLPNEMFNKRNKKISVYIGKPIPHASLDNGTSHAKIAAMIREHLYELKNDYNKEFTL